MVVGSKNDWGGWGCGLWFNWRCVVLGVWFSDRLIILCVEVFDLKILEIWNKIIIKIIKYVINIY